MTARSNTPSLTISEIFFSIQGESSRAGLPSVFVRLTGCPLRCVWCDSEYVFFGGQSMTLPQIIDTVAGYQARQVCVTGGEPLAQKNCLALLTALCDSGYAVSLETSGALDIASVDPRVSRVVDLKARLGFAANRVLFYGVLGYSDAPFDDSGVGYDTKGLVTGLGADFAVSQRVTMGLEYLHRDLSGDNGLGTSLDSSLDTVSLRVGLSF